MQTRGFSFFQTAMPENLKNLPEGYYEIMGKRYEEAGRLDLKARFADGEFGFQQPGEPVTPEFNRKIHVKTSLSVLDSGIYLCWDFGLNPTCLISQITPMSNWLFHEAYVGDGDIGTYELIQDVIKGRIEDRFKGLPILHYGDPMGKMREQSSAENTAIRVLKKELGGRWYPGPATWQPRRDAARRVLGLLRNGEGLVQIDEKRAKPLWQALRGGWHYQKHANGIVSANPRKEINSHPGDAFSYGAAVLFPTGERKDRKIRGGIPIRKPVYFRNARGSPQPPPGLDDAFVPEAPSSVPDHDAPFSSRGNA
jgi:hypothetical protein